jgi:hypothetical protein
MEYLMTYGWTILVVVVVLAALFALGVFDNAGASAASNTCTPISGWKCNNSTLSTAGVLSLTVGEIGSSITITGVGCSTGNSQPSVIHSVSPSVSLGAGQTTTLNIPCPLTSYSLGAKFTGYAWIQYTSPSGGTTTAQLGKFGGYVTSTASPPFGLDGSSSVIYSITSQTFAVTASTTYPNDVIVVYAGFDAPSAVTVSSISDTAGLTWAKRSSSTIASDAFGQHNDQEVWYAVAPTPLSSDIITVKLTTSTGDAVNIVEFGASDANTGSPWDAHAGLPATTAGGASTASATISTTNANTILLGFVGNDEPGCSGTATSWAGSGSYTTIASQINSNNYNWNSGVAYNIVSSAQSSTAITLVDNTGHSCSSTNWMMVGDAIQHS